MPWLLPASWLYGAGVWLRNLLFDKGLFKVQRAGVPVISVGNISAGGTGKTPLVEFLARLLRDRGIKVAVLSRGYGRVTSGYQIVSNGRQLCADAISAGDEPAQMAENLKNVVVAVDERRARGAERVFREFSPGVIILDDGFQHRSLHRDVDIVVVTAGEILETSALLPAGYQREPWSALSRADHLVVSGWYTQEEYEKAESRLADIIKKPVAGMQVVPVGIRRLLTGASSNREELRRQKFIAFSGIGNPERFSRTVAEYLGAPERHEVFGDHHRYDPQDLKQLWQIAENAGAQSLVTTQKDSVRLSSVPGISQLDERLPVHVLNVDASLTSGDALINSVMEKL
ncbi:MAG TPA: tetraacyldisaccharide 4'-kinase [Bacteroidota bacterium]